MPKKKSSPKSLDTLGELHKEKLARKRKLEIINGLPHLYGWKWYKWAREFFESTNKLNFLCAANQISKSSTQIRKCIHWATDQDLWPKLWSRPPVQFWYLYPTKPQATVEFETKWKQFLPRGAFKDHPYWGWKEEKSRGEIVAIHFNSGVHIYFKTYTQDPQALQTGTCDAIFCDEELPIELWDELIFRISASDGYFHMVFTATLGQDFWRKTMEPNENEEENFPAAAKWTVSLYEAKLYEDGTASHWTDERIAQVRARCNSHAEVLKRVYGKFVVIGGRKYECFDATRHMKPKHPIPPSWLVYAGVDIGSGGAKGHPSAICFIGVRPDFKAGRVFLGWRGDGISTTAGDVVQKFIELKKALNITLSGQFYDWANKDFFEIATGMGEPFIAADKTHDKGEEVINTLFKNDILFIYEDEELTKLAGELSTLKKETPKRKAKDDFADAFRYAVTKIPWDWSVIQATSSINYVEPQNPELTPQQIELQERKKAFEEAKEETQKLEDEFDEWNEAYGN